MLRYLIPIKHILNIACFFSIFISFLSLTGFFDRLLVDDDTTKTTIDNESDNKLTFSFLFLIMLKMFGLANFPISLSNLAGFLLYNISPASSDEKALHTLKRSPLLDPFFCIRIVTRGNYPELVRANAVRNMSLCIEYGLDRFVVEVVTDRDIGLPRMSKVRQVIVPVDYKTKHGTMFKARAIQYALEFDRDFISDDDWIVHLDEETALTKSSLTGILNFMYEDKHQIGQGLITYGKESVYNWVTTLADSVRVGSDLGALRFALKKFNRPIFSFKGSFVVCKAGAEMSITFDNGLNGSIAEDTYFAAAAIARGYSFGWVEGEMREQSPHSFIDFVKQRRRWLQGIYLVVHDASLPLSARFWFGFSLYNWIALPAQLCIACFFCLARPTAHIDISCWLPLDFLFQLNATILLYLFVIGSIKSFQFKGRKRWLKRVACTLASLATIPVVVIAETIAVVWGLLTDKRQFYIVNKNFTPSMPSVNV